MRSASREDAAAADCLRVTRGWAGHRTAAAIALNAPARHHPASRAGRSAGPAGTAMARTNDRVAARPPAATYPPSTPEKVTAKPAAAMPATAGQVVRLRSVAPAINTTPQAVSTA